MSLAEETKTECIEKHFSELNNFIEVQKNMPSKIHTN